LDAFDRRPSRLAALPLALLFLLETWVWRKLVALARYVAALLPWERFRDAARRAMNRLPAIFSVALFGAPLIVSEFGAFASVVMMATGHVVVGMGLYVAMKIFGLLLVPVIFEITRERLLALPWFAYLYVRFEALHALAHRFVAPYREAALRLAREIAASARAAWAAFRYAPFRSAARASVAKARMLASSARAVGSSPATPSQ
jgi:hypothetical protein